MDVKKYFVSLCIRNGNDWDDSLVRRVQEGVRSLRYVYEYSNKKRCPWQRYNKAASGLRARRLTSYQIDY